MAHLDGVVLEALDAKVLDGGPEPVELGLYPGLLDGHRLAGVGGTGLVHHPLSHRQEVRHAHVPSHDKAAKISINFNQSIN